MHRYPPPEPRELLLPVIACLPTAFFSPRPPPALLPLLSPILRQRVSLLAANPQQPASSSSNRSTWLHLLTWSTARAERLDEICSNLQLEPHPVSGELELFDDEDGGEAKIEYRRLDLETFQAKCDVRKYGLGVIWTWCVNDTGPHLGASESEDGPRDGTLPKDGWRVAEVLPLEEHESEGQGRSASDWYSSQGEAEEAAASLPGTIATIDVPTATLKPEAPKNGAGSARKDEEEDDADYWASYDRSPSARTPAPRGAGTTATPNNLPGRQGSADERDYFARYGEVQPAMDSHDPDEADAVAGFESTVGLSQQQQHSDGALNGVLHDPNTSDPKHMHTSVFATDSFAPPVESDATPRIHSPQPSRPATPSSPVEKLESSACAVSAAEVGVKQHISTEMKSLYRLARASGIDREEFERIIRRELEVLDMLEM